MTVKITDFQTYAYIHDDAPGGSHGGTLDPSTVRHGENIDGSTNLNVISVPCPYPDCGSVSYWPVGGGADALLGQTLFVIKEAELPQNKDATVSSVADSVKQRVIDTDGEERWVLDDAALRLVATITGRSYAASSD